MNGIDFLIDTNVVIYVLEGQPIVKGMMHCSVAVSVVSEMELLGKQNISKHEEIEIQSLLSDCEILDFNEKIKNLTIEIKKQFNMKLPDAIIAATAKLHKLLLITADKDFKKLEGYIDIVIIDRI